MEIIILEKLINFSKDEWEKFKIDFDLAFVKYLKKSYEKYSKIKTILYRTEPKYIYDFFEVPYLKFESSKKIKANNIDDLISISKFILIQGTGGIGKSTLMKHLFINELEKKDLIPILVELKDINDYNENYNISDIIINKINDLGCSFDEKYFDYALKTGAFLFLLDGYDEILTSNRDLFFKKLDSFCDKYSDNYYIISSRPYSEFVEFQRFTVISTCPLSKQQAISLVERIDFDIDIKNRFIKDLENNLYEKHKSFASNPLLLNIMLMTYDNYAEIPEKLHLFYANAFETLYSKHDATKAGYRRELESILTYDSFKRIFSYFCFLTYAQGKIEFTYEELIDYFNKIRIEKITFDTESYIKDLINSLCVVYKDGFSYKFAHRSFQEYFTALFLKELPDDIMGKMSIHLIEIDGFKISHDTVFDMLYDMSEDRFEKNILITILNKIEDENLEDKYNFYFEKIVDFIKFDKGSDENSNKNYLWLCRTIEDDYMQFIYGCTKYYYNKDNISEEKLEKAADNVLDYLINNMSYEIGDEINCDEIIKNERLYELIKDTWIGERVSIMSELNQKLKKKQKKVNDDLFMLLGEI